MFELSNKSKKLWKRKKHSNTYGVEKIDKKKIMVWGGITW
jgi:hypothetical protein